MAGIKQEPPYWRRHSKSARSLHEEDTVADKRNVTWRALWHIEGGFDNQSTVARN